MDILTGMVLFGGGAAIGGVLVAEYYSALRQVQEHERKASDKRMEEAARQMDMLDTRLAMNTNALRDMETKRAVEASWCDGYEAGMREGMENAMQGVTLGDVVTMTRLRNARRLRSVNE